MRIDNKAYGLLAVIPFGKYEGKTIGNVIESDPQYLLWAEDNIPNFKLTFGAQGLAFDNFYALSPDSCLELDVNP